MSLLLRLLLRLLLNSILHLVAILPLSVAHRLGILTGILLSKLPHTYQFSASKNLQICKPELNAAQAKALKLQSFKESGKAVWELSAIWMWPAPRVLPLIKQVSGQTLLDNAIKKGDGVILALPHIGCWEIIGMHCSSLHAMTSLYRPSRIPSIDAIMVKSRQRFGATLVPTNNSGIRKIYAALKRNELVAILPDQDPRNEGNVFADFFDFPANTATLLPRLAQKTSAAVIFAFAERLKNGEGFHLHYLPASEHIYDADLVSATTAVNQGVEQCIALVPEQYQWTYKRFKTRPEGEQPFY